MADAKFEFEAMKSVMDSISTDFTTLATAFDTINEAVTTKLNVTADSSVYGDVGDDLLDVWSANASTFGDFKKNFETWAETMTIIHNRNQSFSDEAVASFASNTSSGLSLDGIADARNVAALAAGYAYAGYDSDGAIDGSFDDRVYVAGATGAGIHTYTAENGFKYVYETDENGNMLSIMTYNSSGAVVDFKTFDVVNGGVSSQVVYDGNTAIKYFYDENGMEINSATFQANSNGIVGGSPYQATYVENGKTYTAVADGSGTYTIYEGTEIVTSALVTTGVSLATLNGKLEVERGYVNNNYGTSTIDKVEGTYTGEYDGRTILIPTLTSDDFSACANYSEREALMFSNAQVIVGSGTAVAQTLDAEAATLKNVLTNYENFVGALTPEQQAVMSRIQTAYDERTSISAQIKEDCYQGSGTDGAVGDASAGHASVSDQTWGSRNTTWQHVDYDEAVNAASSWNASLSNLDDMEELEEALAAAGLSDFLSPTSTRNVSGGSF